MTERPPRPRTESPQELGFEPARAMVPWLSPSQLMGTAVRVVLSQLFGSYSDKREIEASLRELPPQDYSGRTDVWLDFVADLGDAFGPTYTMASLLARDELELGLAGSEPAGSGGRTEPHATARGRVLVMGGDEVYPTASVRDYENKTIGPYRAALPFSADPPDLYAIPGNHDWYDGLTGFMRVFCSGGWIGGWRTRQTRSYFALRLPGQWWVFGIDTQFDTYIDEPQYRYFDETVGPHLAAGDSVILCSPTPTWVKSNEPEHDDAYGTVDYLDRKIIRPRGAEIRLALSGDAHHYARYAQTDGSGQRITAGGGGAFLSATHHLPETLELPPHESRDPGKTSPPTHWRLERAYPSKGESRRLRWRAAELPFLNPSLWVFVGFVFLFYAWMIQGSLRTGGVRFSQLMPVLGYDDLLRGLVRSPLAIILSLILARGLVGFTKSKVTAKKWSLGLGHAVVQLVAIVSIIAVATAICSGLDLSGIWFVAAFAVLTGVGGGLLGCWVLGAYLLVADRFGLNTNELFAAQRNRDWKNFLRLHLAGDGVLTVYPVAVDRTPRRWRLRTAGDEAQPWFEAQDRPVAARLIEEPIRVLPAEAPATATARARRAAKARPAKAAKAPPAVPARAKGRRRGPAPTPHPASGPGGPFPASGAGGPDEPPVR